MALSIHKMSRKVAQTLLIASPSKQARVNSWPQDPYMGLEVTIEMNLNQPFLLPSH